LTAEKVPARSSTSWVFQRVTGAMLAFFLATHIVTLHFQHKGAFNFSEVYHRVSSSNGWLVFYFLFILTAFLHALTGLWAITLDFRPSPGGQKAVMILFWVVGLAFSIFSIFTLRAFVSG